MKITQLYVPVTAVCIAALSISLVVIADVAMGSLLTAFSDVA